MSFNHINNPLFAETAPYSSITNMYAISDIEVGSKATTVGITGSIYFNGTNHIRTTDEATPGILNGVTSGTYEFYVYLENSNEAWIYNRSADNSLLHIISVGKYINGSGSRTLGDAGKLYFNGMPGANQLISSNTILNPRTWYHVAITFSSTSCKIYINGALDNTDNNDWSVPNFLETGFGLYGTIVIGGTPAVPAAAGMKGYITSFRYVAGTEVYAENFTPSTIPLTNITGTRILLNANSSTNVYTDQNTYRANDWTYMSPNQFGDASKVWSEKTPHATTYTRTDGSMKLNTHYVGSRIVSNTYTQMTASLTF